MEYEILIDVFAKFKSESEYTRIATLSDLEKLNNLETEFCNRADIDYYFEETNYGFKGKTVFDIQEYMHDLYDWGYFD